MGLHLGQVEVGSRALGQGGLGVVDDVEGEVEERAGHLLAVHLHMRLGQVPAARADDQHGGLVAQRVVLARVGIGEGELALPAVLQVHLPFDHVAPGRRGGVLEVGHIGLGPGVQGVDDHLAVDRAGELDAAVEQVLRNLADPPVAGADVGGLGQEVGPLAGVEAGLPLGAGLEQLEPAGVEAAMQVRDEAEGFRGQHLLAPRRGGADQLHAFDPLLDNVQSHNSRSSNHRRKS